MRNNLFVMMAGLVMAISMVTGCSTFGPVSARDAQVSALNAQGYYNNWIRIDPEHTNAPSGAHCYNLLLAESSAVKLLHANYGTPDFVLVCALEEINIQLIYLKNNLFVEACWTDERLPKSWSLVTVRDSLLPQELQTMRQTEKTKAEELAKRKEREEWEAKKAILDAKEAASKAKIAADVAAREAKEAADEAARLANKQAGEKAYEKLLADEKAAEVQAIKDQAAREARQRVEFDDSLWVVVSTVNKGNKIFSPNEYVSPAHTEGMFVKVTYTVRNKGKTEQRILAVPRLADSEDRKYNQYENQNSYMRENEKGMVLESLPAGMTKKFVAFYEVSTDAKGLKFEARSFAMIPSLKYIPFEFQEDKPDMGERVQKIESDSGFKFSSP